jgi:hypothetical protein
LDPSITVGTTVGGIAAGTTAGFLFGKNLVQLFDDILFPTLLPTYTIPTITLTSSVTGIYEIGATLSPNLTASGTKNDAGAFSYLGISRLPNGTSAVQIGSTGSPTIASATAIPSQFGYASPNNPNYSYSFIKGDSLTGPAPLSGNNSTLVYSATGSYSAGLAKQNNKGATDTRTPLVRSTSAPQDSSTNFAASNVTLTGYYPYYYGKSSTQQTASNIVSIIQSGTGFTKVVASGSGSLSMTFNASSEWPWFAIFSGYSTKTAWYETPLNNGSIGSPTDLFASPTTLSIISPDGYWVVTYKVYPSNKITTLGTASIS